MPDRFATRMASVYAASFLFTGLQMPFFPPWLAARGLDARDIGLVLAGGTVAKLVALPVASRVSDRFGLLREPLVVAALVAMAAYLALGLSHGVIAIACLYAIAAMATGPIFPLTDAYTMRGLAARRARYGAVRLWGSVTFIVANLCGGVVLQTIGAADIVWVLAAAMSLTLFTVAVLPPLPAVAAGGAPPAKSAASAIVSDDASSPAAAFAAWRVPGFAAAIVAASFIQASHALFYAFSAVQWSDAGLNGVTIGLLWAVGVLAEIVLFAFSGRFVGRLGARSLMLIGGCGGALRWSAMTMDPPLTLLVPLQALHALSFGATHLGVMDMLGRIAPSRGAAAQGDYALVQGIAFAAATAAAGLLFQQAGSVAYGAMAASAAVGAIIVWVARPLRRRPEPA